MAAPRYGVPGDGGVGEQGEALGSDVLVVGSASVESAVVGEEQLTAEGVEGFALQTDAFCTFTRPTPTPRNRGIITHAGGKDLDGELWRWLS